MSKARLQEKVILGPEVLDVNVCQHHWVIDKPSGPTSRGLCRNCSEERDFLNYWEGSAWGGDAPVDQVGVGSRISLGVDLTADTDFTENDEDN
ncbi:MAG: hypothetical protein O3A47_06480 [Chloroflexi bacterium]|nr:hypothetical protein [Chloroflexota bacterium]